VSDLESILGGITGLTPAGIGLMALAGLVVGVAPSSYPLLAAAAGFSAGGQAALRRPAPNRGVWLASGFVLGVALVDAALGALFGLFGFAVLRALSPYMAHTYFLLSLVLLLLALAMLRIVRVNLRLVYASPRAVDSFGAAFLLGIPFGLSTCPACTPLLLPVLMTAAASGDAIMGAALLFVFGIARGIPILLVGAATGLLTRLGSAMLWVPRIERAAGVLLLIAAAAFAYQAAVYAGWLPRV
jgi:cytochrome c-type biogenesis protein